MAKTFATMGAQLHIGAAKAFNGEDFVPTDFTTGSPTWTEVGGLINLGQMGDTAQLITTALINEARDRKQKGTRNAGSMQVVCSIDYEDAGQLALIAAEKTSLTYAFRITLNDAPAGGTPSYRYFVALVMSVQEQFDEANSVMRLNATLEIDSNIAKTPAATA